MQYFKVKNLAKQVFDFGCCKPHKAHLLPLGKIFAKPLFLHFWHALWQVFCFLQAKRKLPILYFIVLALSTCCTTTQKLYGAKNSKRPCNNVARPSVNKGYCLSAEFGVVGVFLSSSQFVCSKLSNILNFAFLNNKTSG